MLTNLYSVRKHGKLATNVPFIRIFIQLAITLDNMSYVLFLARDHVWFYAYNAVGWVLFVTKTSKDLYKFIEILTTHITKILLL